MILRRAHHCSRSFVVTVDCLWAVTSLGCADGAAPPQASAPSATIVSVEGTSTTDQTRDWTGKPVTVRAPSQSAADITDKNTASTVRAIITAVDPALQRVKVRTSKNQTIVLAMAPGSLA